ncbi:hypothetical protein C8Q75DRAFT_802270 [Abortiporus biennis]|nr:hypothetical protein C8Q75DRAFT_802270 [Abortiporus biennis]
MEKFSAFRDPGTGIQPFLTPLPPGGQDVLATLLLPIGYALGIVKTTLIVILGIIYVLLVQGLFLVFKPVPPLYRGVTYIFTALIARLVLLLVGLWRIPVEEVARKRVRGAKLSDPWNPRAGDVIVSNWASWVEILWLAFRFNPIFILPVTSPVDLSPQLSLPSTPITRTPGRRTGTGSAAISSPSTRKPTPRSNILGFRKVSLLSILSFTGNIPSASPTSSVQSFEDIRQNADRPIVIFPECTSSNGRALLRLADVFTGIEVPVMKFKIFVMCVRYDAPTAFAPTLSHSVPSSFLNPLPHIFKLATTVSPLTLSIRLLKPSDGPSSGSLLVSDFIHEKCDDPLSEICAALMSQIGKVKRVGLGWEDKAAFFEFYSGKRK